MRKTSAVLASIACALVVLTVRTAADDGSQAAKLYELLELEPDMTIADIGAGSGEMTVLLAKRLDKSGRVYSTDINQDRLKEIRAAASKAHLDNVVVLEGAEKATNLPDACCDAIFIRNVYHHFGDPPAMNRSLLAALKPGGRLAIIDFVPRKGSERPNGSPASRGGHGVTSDIVSEEVTAVGFTRVETIDKWDGRQGEFLVLFRKN
jgi:ubiquinone/menaquinone biosynthesis C-methylase UbiE